MKNVLIDCPICGNNLRHNEKEVEYIINDNKIKINIKGDYCDECSEFFLTKEELKRTNKELRRKEKNVQSRG